MIDTIAFDADDTLWQNEILYIQAKNQFKQILSSYNQPEEAGRWLDELEVHNLRFYGYGIKSFTLSMAEAAIEASQEKINGKELREIIAIAKQMLSANIQLFEKTEETLALLAEKYRLLLITKGDTFEQGKKVSRSGLAGYFRHIEIVPEKTKETYQALLEKYQINPDQFLMVGNSVRSDILPVVEIGGQAVYIPSEYGWFHETVSEDDHANLHYMELENLGQLPALIETLNGNLS